MNGEKILLISFSARQNGNCDDIIEFLGNQCTDLQIDTMNICDLSFVGCTDCNYQCMNDRCLYHDDDIYSFLDDTKEYKKVVYIVPMYCGFPSSFYFALNERSQDYWMQNEKYYNDFTKKIYIIGIGNDNNNLLFQKIFEENFY